MRMSVFFSITMNWHKFDIRMIILFILAWICLPLHIKAWANQCNEVIQPGDTLAKICYRHLGKYNESIVREVLRMNPGIANPNLIFAGKRIYLPCQDLKVRDTQKIEQPVQDSAQKDVIKHGTQAPEKDLVQPLIAKSLPSDKPASEKGIAIYPPPMPGDITRLKWVSDNAAIVEGRVKTGTSCRFFVYVPGDLEYEQPDLEIQPDGAFQARAIIGRQGRDYGTTFILKLALFNKVGERIGEIRRSVVRQQHERDEVVQLRQKGTSSSSPKGWSGVEAWVAIQGLDAMQSDNSYFRVPKGHIIANFRYLGYNPDERYLSWYGRITLYGSSCLAKAFLLKGKVREAEAILRVWAAQADHNGKVPRSANVIGDNYVSPDVRTGEIAHFLGALAAAKAVTGSGEWDEPIRKIVNNYLEPLTDPDTRLIRGGYNGKGSEGYTKPGSYEMLTWCSAEHNFDLFQALVLLARIYNDSDFADTCRNLASQLAKGIDEYLWDEKAGTFNQGWNEKGPDQNRALDCSSWGALYLLKQARIAENQSARRKYLAKARRCLEYAEKHFRTRWHYQTPEGKKGHVKGYRPYDGIVDDLRWEEGKNSGKLIDWKSLNDMVWSEGTLGVAKAWEEFARQTGDKNAEKRYRDIYRQMLKLQSLSDRGGVLYSTRQIKGQFTMGEELASLGWMGYLASISDGNIAGDKYDYLVKWMPW